MRKRRITDVAASIRQRLLNLSRERTEDFGLILSQYAIERLLYRLSCSDYASEFVLKGAQLFALWSGTPHRATRDLDLLCYGEAALARMEAVFRDVCQQQVSPPDGIVFLADTVRGRAIREQTVYDGVRILVDYALSAARDRVQIDIGFGDVLTPGPAIVEVPTLLDLPAPRVQAYVLEAVVAEKLEAMVVLGIRNSRMKDYYDLWALARGFNVDGVSLCRAIRATFSRRRTNTPADPPVGLSNEFCEDRTKRAQWKAFLRRGRLPAETDLTIVVSELREFLMPPILAVAAGRAFTMAWSYASGWLPKRG